MPRRRIVRRKRGRGIGDLLKDVGGGLGGGINRLFGGLFGGRRKRVHRRKGRGLPFAVKAALGPIGTALHFAGLGRKRRRGRGLFSQVARYTGNITPNKLVAAAQLLGGRRRRRGRGAGDSITSRINNVLKDSKIVSKALNEFGNPYGLSGIAGTLGYGRRHGRRVHRRRGGMSHSVYVRPMMGGGQLNF